MSALPRGIMGSALTWRIITVRVFDPRDNTVCPHVFTYLTADRAEAERRGRDAVPLQPGETIQSVTIEESEGFPSSGRPTPRITYQPAAPYVAPPPPPKLPKVDMSTLMPESEAMKDFRVERLYIIEGGAK